MDKETVAGLKQLATYDELLLHDNEFARLSPTEQVDVLKTVCPDLYEHEVEKLRQQIIEGVD